MHRFANLAALICLSAVTVAADVPSIPPIKTLDDLRHVAPIKLSDGAEVRIGMTEAVADGIPWRLVYCLPVDPNARPTNPNGDPEEWLGPVRVRVLRDRQVEEVSGSVQASELPQRTGEAFYCTAVPVFNEGTFQIEVLGPKSERGGKETPILQSSIEVKKDATCVWHRFAEKTGDIYTLAAQTRAMRPRYSGMTRHSAGDPKADAALDGFDAEHPLTLALDLSVAEPKLVLGSAEEMINSPDEHLLARWWVNGRPIVAQPSPAALEQKLMQHGWRISFVKEIQLVFALPSILGPLKVGDTVALQLMYSPAGTKPLFEKATPEMRQQVLQTFVPRILSHPATLPRLSEKLEIVVTREMLPK